MERFDISEAGRFADMVSAAERGEDVEIMRDDKIVAHVVATRGALIRQVEALRDRLPAEARAIDWGRAVREMRDDARGDDLSRYQRHRRLRVR